ncbi:MAG: PIN domain-containing protein [Cyclobacteriaceae bacterium]|nr:PIN domain-containing protein [Cyclobacteriaceae bacterium]
MNGRRYLADTNAFIYLLKKESAIAPLLDSEWYFSFVTEIELLGKPRITEKEINQLRNLLSVAHKLAHSDEISEKAIKLRQRYALKTPDASLQLQRGSMIYRLSQPMLVLAKLKR